MLFLSQPDFRDERLNYSSKKGRFSSESWVAKFDEAVAEARARVAGEWEEQEESEEEEKESEEEEDEEEESEDEEEVEQGRRIKRVRCRQCAGCFAPDCGECSHCKDMPKFGGPGTQRQACVQRKCKWLLSKSERAMVRRWACPICTFVNSAASLQCRMDCGTVRASKGTAAHLPPAHLPPAAAAAGSSDGAPRWEPMEIERSNRSQTGFAGVRPQGKRFSAHANGLHLGIFPAAEEAARARTQHMQQRQRQEKEEAEEEAQQKCHSCWVQCDGCQRWRLLVGVRDTELSAGRWTCNMSADPWHNTCVSHCTERNSYPQP